MYVKKGIKAMLPITAGVIPFGLVMGTVASDAQLSLLQTMAMNFTVFAGASQLAAVDLMRNSASSIVVILTGVIINLRFLLYSASLSTFLDESRAVTKGFCAYSITDQSYAALMANQEQLPEKKHAILFYLGASVCMITAWQSSVALGFVFGNFAPASMALDFAVPLSFVALVLPSLKNSKYVYVAALSFCLSIVLKDMPFNLGLIVAALLSIALGTFLSRRG